MDVVAAGLRIYVFLAGVLCLAMTLWCGRRWIALRRSGVRGVGNITGWTVTKDTEGNPEYFYPRVRFVARSGAAYDFTSTGGWGHERWPVGAPVPILYMPGDPQRAELDRPVIEVVGFGLMLALSGLALYAAIG